MMFAVTPRKINGWNLRLYPIEEENHRLQTIIFSFDSLIFAGVSVSRCLNRKFCDFKGFHARGLLYGLQVLTKDLVNFSKTTKKNKVFCGDST